MKGKGDNKMKMYIEGTNKWIKIEMRKWLDNHYGADFSADILIDFEDGAEYSEEEIHEAIEWCVEYYDEYDCQLLVEEGEE